VRRKASVSSFNSPTHEMLAPISSRRASETGRSNYRFYGEFALPGEYGGGTILVSITGRPGDKARALNRAENIRLIARSDAAFKRLYRRRSDTETINDIFERALYLKKAHSLGYRGQPADTLAFALAEHAIVLHRHRRRREVAHAA
jgi:hypothetical protein